ncbi:MAG: glycosyltransferase family 4 protein [Fibrobacteres bacterium]|nr:glycosyltransferase family 4 protein [Fibrobacterota bacterium]
MGISRILHIVNVPWFNAVAWYAFNTALAQQKAGCTVHIAGDPHSPCLERAKSIGLNSTASFHISTHNVLQQISSLFKLRKYIEDNNIDVVNCHHNVGLWVSIKAAQWAKNRPLIVITHGHEKPLKSHFLNRLFFNSWSDGVIATSKCIHKGLKETLRLQDDKLKLILPSVDTEYFKRNSQLEDTSAGNNDPFPVFGLIGRLDEKKGHYIALKAMKKLITKGYNIRYVIAGPESELKYEELKIYAREEKLTQRIFFLGRVTDIRDVYRICDCGIIASTASEAICRVALEFMAMRIPVIASRLHGIPDVVPEDNGCALFKTGDVDSLADKMENFLLNHKLWTSWKLSSRSYADKNHYLSKLASESLEFYDSLRGRKRPN